MKEEGDIAWALELRLKKMVRQLSRSIQTLEEDVQEWPEATKYELLLLSAKLEKSPGKHGHCLADFHPSEGRSCPPGQPASELILLRSSQGMDRDSPSMGNSFCGPWH